VGDREQFELEQWDDVIRKPETLPEIYNLFMK
jgi:hypothetical protein